MGKVPEYTRRAINKYKERKYNLSVALPLEYKELILSTGFSGNGFVNEAVKNELVRRGLLQSEQTEDSARPVQ